MYQQQTFMNTIIFSSLLKKMLLSAAGFFLFAGNLYAQDETSNFNAEARVDVVSQYIWRGCYLSGASIQPSLTGTYKNVSLNAWGSADFQATGHEVDFSLKYAFFGFEAGITDYWSGELETPYSKGHSLEGNLLYSFPKFPLTLAWNTVFYGEESPENYSSYAEASYLLELPALNFEFAVGFTPWKNQMLDTDQFAFTKLSVAANKEFYLNKTVHLDFLLVLQYNPAAEKMFFVAGIGLCLP